MEAPKITVLMPVYNGEKYLSESIHSILSQTFSDFEFLIIDDGSTDNTSNIVLSFSDLRIRFIKNQNNRGLVANLNMGVEMAKGEYIVRMDADDISLSKRLEKQYEFMSTNRDVAVCGTAIKFFGYKRGDKYYPTDNESIRARMLFESPFAHPSVIMRTEIFRLGGLRYSENFEFAQDYDLWTKIPNGYRLANLGQILLKYRVHDGNINKEKHKLQVAVADRIRSQFLRKLGYNASPKNMELFFQIAQKHENSSRKFIEAAEELLLSILLANDHCKIFKRSAFRKEIGLFWWETCFHSSALGLRAWSYYMESELSGYAPIRFKYQVIFFLRSLLRFSKIEYRDSSYKKGKHHPPSKPK